MDSYSYWKYGLLNLQIEVNPAGRLVNQKGLEKVLKMAENIVKENENEIFY